MSTGEGAEDPRRCLAAIVFAALEIVNIICLELSACLAQRWSSTAGAFPLSSYVASFIIASQRVQSIVCFSTLPRFDIGYS